MEEWCPDFIYQLLCEPVKSGKIKIIFEIKERLATSNGLQQVYNDLERADQKH